MNLVQEGWTWVQIKVVEDKMGLVPQRFNVCEEEGDLVEGR